MLDQVETQNSRRAFLQKAAIAGAGVAGMAAVLPTNAFAAGATQNDVDILGAAEIAEALAVTTYTNIINNAPFFKRLAKDDQGYLKAARQEEMSHYLLEKGALGNKPSPFTAFYYPKHMFYNAHVDAEHAGQPRGRVHRRLSGRRAPLLDRGPAGHRGADHGDRVRPPHARSSGRPGVAHRDGGPIEKVTGLQGVAESVDPPNNNGYERTLGLKNISGAVDALMPFLDKTAAGKAGFDTHKVYKFHPFTPTLPNKLGEFHSFAG